MKERDYFICNVEKPMYERYDKAVENNDKKELAWFAQFGSEKWENQMITNARVYEQYLSCGYSGEPTFNDIGWLTNGHCTELRDKAETITVFKDDTAYAIVMLLKHPNGKWIATLDYSFSQSGGGAYPNIWDKQHPSRRDALNAVLDRLIALMEKSNISKDRKHLPDVKQMRGSTGQLSLFEDMF